MERNARWENSPTQRRPVDTAFDPWILSGRIAVALIPLDLIARQDIEDGSSRGWLHAGSFFPKRFKRLLRYSNGESVFPSREAAIFRTPTGYSLSLFPAKIDSELIEPTVCTTPSGGLDYCSYRRRRTFVSHNFGHDARRPDPLPSTNHHADPKCKRFVIKTVYLKQV